MLNTFAICTSSSISKQASPVIRRVNDEGDIGSRFASQT